MLYRIVKHGQTNQTDWSEYLLRDIHSEAWATTILTNLQNDPENSAYTFTLESYPDSQTVKLELAKSILNDWHINTDNLDTKTVFKLLKTVGYTWSRTYAVWYEQTPTHELFKLHWQLAIDVQNIDDDQPTNGLYNVAVNSLEWLLNNGFDPVDIYERWQQDGAEYHEKMEIDDPIWQDDEFLTTLLRLPEPKNSDEIDD